MSAKTFAQTFAQKALARAAGVGSVEIGQVVDTRPDVVLSHDNTAAIRKIWMELGQERVVIPDRMAITLDHAVPAPTTAHARNHAEVRRFVREQGVRHFFEVGRGICHQVLSEEAIVRPGQLVLGADSHTPHFGWMGAFGAGVGRSEVAALWATGELWLRVPESLQVTIDSPVPPSVTGKDIALHLLSRLGADGGLYRSVEFAGDGLATLSLESRMSLANMMAEMGVKCTYLPPDGPVFDFLAAASGRSAEELARTALYPDLGAPYVMRVSVDASELRPMVARPHRVDNVVAVDELGDVRVDQAFIGTCTNGRLEDLQAVHRILRGRRVAAGTRLLIVPAASRVLEDAMRTGLASELMAAGAIFGTPGCGPCMGNHLGVLAPGEVCISSGNRNFRGRMGTPEAEIYLSSPAVVAASALAGRICAPDAVGVAD